MKVLESKNKEYGFYGTTIRNRKRKISIEWPAAFEWVHKAVPVWSSVMIREYLDGRYGRHLADEACDARGVAKVNPERWMETFFIFAKEFGKEQEIAGIQDSIQADKEIKKACNHLANAKKHLEDIMNSLPEGKPLNEFQEKMKSDAENRLDMIHAFLGE